MKRALLGLLLAALALAFVVLSVERRAAALHPAITNLAHRTPIREPLQGARSAHLTLEADVGEVHLGTHHTPGVLLSGEAELPTSAGLIRTVAREGGLASVTYRLEASRNDGGVLREFFAGRAVNPKLDLRLHRDVPTDLQVHSDVGSVRLDLRDATLRNLQVMSSVGGVRVTLPQKGQYRANLQTDVGAVQLTLPPGLAARVTVRHDVGEVRLPPTFTRDGDVYTSPGFARATNRADLTVRSDVGRIEVRQESAQQE